MEQKISEVAGSFKAELNNVKDETGLEAIRIKYFSRNGLFSKLFEDFKNLPKDQKPKYGKLLNKTKAEAQKEFDLLKNKINSRKKQSQKFVDLSLPGRKKTVGSQHLISQTIKKISSVFKGLGFSVYTGPEIESDENNFEALNFPPDHPARDMQDTFFINDNFLLRTHTSPVQIRLMRETNPPIRAIIPGKVYRNEAISAKSYCLFHQIEGLYVDTNVTFAELKSTLVYFAKNIYGNDVKYRFRSSFFPFTEPSAEVDVWWQPPGKEGKWLEILGCGMVDPNVLQNVGIDPEKYTGYAFGMGVERIAMLKYGLSDIRILFDNDKRFLTQF